MSNTICPIPDKIIGTPEYQALKEKFGHIFRNKDFVLVQAISLYRDKNGYDSNWYPTTDIDIQLFEYYCYNIVSRKKSTSGSTHYELLNLYEKLYTVFTPEQLKDRIDSLVYDFILMVDRLEQRTPGVSRTSLIESYEYLSEKGYKAIFKFLQDEYDSHTGESYNLDQFIKRYKGTNKVDEVPDSELVQFRSAAKYTAELYKPVVDNFDMLAALAINKVGIIEGFVVRTDGMSVGLSDTSEENLEDGFDDIEVDEDVNDDSDGTKGERYSDFRTTKLMQTISVVCRRILFGIPVIDSRGKTATSSFFRTKYLDVRNIVVALKKIALESTPESFLNDIEEACVETAWLKGVYNRLKDDQYATAVVYNAVKGCITRYGYTKIEKGEYNTHLSNTKGRNKMLAQNAGNNLSGGLIGYDDEYGIVGTDGMIKTRKELTDIQNKTRSSLEKVASITKLISTVKDNRLTPEELEKKIKYLVKDCGGKPEDYEYLKLGGVDAMRVFLDKNPEVVTDICCALRGFGFEVTPKNIYDSALQSLGTKANVQKYWGKYIYQHQLGDKTNRLLVLTRVINDLYHLAGRLTIKNDIRYSTGKYLYGAYPEPFVKVSNLLSISVLDELEPRVVSSGKSLQAINNINLLHQVFDGLYKMSDEDVMEKYLQYEGMGLGYGENIRATGWLRSGDRDHAIMDSLGFNNVEYGKMSSQQHMTNALLNYFMPPVGFSTCYEVCIQSDYGTAYNFVTGHVYSKEELIGNVIDELLIEIERIAAIQERQKNHPERVEYNVYEKQGQHIHILPELNSNGFLEEYNNIKQDNPAEAESYLRRVVGEQLDKIAAHDAKYFEEKGIFNNKYLSYVTLYSRDNAGVSFYDKEGGKFDNLEDKAKEALNLMFMNYYYARHQITKLTVGDLSHFDGLSDFEKRNMLVHAPHTSLFVTEDMKYGGKDAGFKDKSQRVVYLGDDVQASYYLEQTKKALHSLLSSGKITKEQYDRMCAAYESIKTTDGQGLRTLESYRKVCIASGNWSERQESAYNRIMEGKPKSSDIEMFFNPIKPVYTGYDVIPAVNGENQKPIRATVLHKYAEVILLPESLFGSCVQAQSTPMRALSRAAKENDIDLMLFQSGVKVGAFSVVKPFENHTLTNEDDIVSWISSEIKKNPSAVHTLKMDGYGISASVAAHGEDDKISISTQAEKECFADIEDGEVAYIVDGEKEGDRQSMSTSKLRDIFYQTKAVDIMEAYDELRKLFGSTENVSRILKEELQSKPYYSREMVFAIEQIGEHGTAMPLFSPGIRHNIEQLFASIIIKRITKPRNAGSNIPEATAFGIDVDSTPFESTIDFPKLGIEFNTDNGVRRQYIEVYMPIHNSAFSEFADENGVITPERLEKLIESGQIPQEALEFIAYRTPSDYTHSLFNCRIKGFIAGTGGQVLYMPKDCMVSDGHDYDGDKKRCHFPQVKAVWDYDKLHNEYMKLDEETRKHFPEERFIKRETEKSNPNRSKWRKIEYNAYDFDRPAKENSKEQRYNGRIRMMFATLSSVSGTARALTPGEFDETKVTAKTMYIIKNIDRATGELRSFVDSFNGDTVKLYKALLQKTNKELTSIMNELNSNESPFSMTHAAESYDYIMGPSDMIGIYAMYGSTAMMLQRANLAYNPATTKDGKPYNITIFGHTIDKFYKIRDRKNQYASTGRSHLLCAAVDNPKDAILGFLNQTPELASITNLLQAAGYTEHDIHLIMNQPAVVGLSDKLAEVGEDGISNAIDDLINQLIGDNATLQDYKFTYAIRKSLDTVAKLSEDDCIRMLSIPLSKLGSENMYTELEAQIAILGTLKHLLPAATTLTEFVRLVRPESESGSIGTSVSEAIQKKSSLDSFRQTMEDDNVRILGMGDILGERTIVDDMSRSVLPEVSAMNTTLADNSLDLFERYFPEANESWRTVASRVADMYWLKGNSQKSRRMNKIIYEMTLWKLLSSKTGFIRGEIKEEQMKILHETPRKVGLLKKRITKAQKELELVGESKDKAAAELVGNVFLQHLTSDVTNPVSANRLRFSINGPAVEGMKDDITAGWNQLMMSRDKDIRQLAVDLFKYNIFSNGLEFGMYEFSHFVPFSVLVSTPGYIAALQSIMKSDFSDDTDCENFINQYFMNHWSDYKFLHHVKKSDLKDLRLDGKNIIITQNDDSDVVNRLIDKPFVVIHSGENNKVTTLYRLSFDGTNQVLVPTEKLGYTHKDGGQITLQYNPQVMWYDMAPIVSTKREYMGRSESQVFSDSNIEGATYTSEANDSLVSQMNAVIQGGVNTPMGLGAFMAAKVMESRKNEMKQAESKTQDAVAKNDAANTKSQDAAILEAIGYETAPSNTNSGDNTESNTQKDDAPNRSIFAKITMDMFGGKKLFNISSNKFKNTSSHDLFIFLYENNKIDNERLKELIKRIWSKTCRFTRLPAAVETWFATPPQIGGRLIAQAIRRIGEPDLLKPSGKNIRITKDISEQINSEIIKFAKDNDFYIDHYDIENSYNIIAEKDDTAESEVYKDDNGQVIKIMSAHQYANDLGHLLDGITAFNGVNKDFCYHVIGFTHNKAGEPCAVVVQQLANGQRLDEITNNPDDLDAMRYEAIRQNGFELAGTYGAKKDGIHLSDLHEANIIKMNDGKYIIIDANAYLDTIQGEVEYGEYDVVDNENISSYNNNQYLSLAHRNEDGTVTIDKVPATPDNIREARKQKVYVELNKKLREILRLKGISVGVLDNAEARLGINGVADFDTPSVVAEGLLELIRIAEGTAGEESLPEEFAHVALELLGHEHPLVKRLLSTLKNNPAAMREVYGEDYEEYAMRYDNDMDTLVLEAAGKLVAKQLLYQQEIESAPVRPLVRRICDAIKEFIRKVFRRDEIQNAIFEANGLATKVAQGVFGGKLIDAMSVDNISQSKQLLSVKRDISNKQDIVSKLIKINVKRLNIIKKRIGNDTRFADRITIEENQVAQLEQALMNYQTEDTVLNYMNNAISYLAKTEESLDNSLSSGKKANDVCKKLNTIRDTLYSFSQAINAVNEAIVNGEISNSELLADSIDKVQGVVSRFYRKYETLAKTYFEEMLSNVYGESGVTVNIGKDRGRVITIKDMANKMDADLGFMSRWFHSLADCNDYVLMAIDDVTRRAKMRSRSRLVSVRPLIERAVAALIKETGSRDTSFMFEMRRFDGGTWCNGADDDGKLHKTGKYISKDSKEYAKLSPAQKDFYDTFMEIKKDADNCIPESLRKENRIIMLRKYTLQKVKDAEGIGDKMLAAWDGVKASVLEMGEDYDPEYQNVAVDFENNKVDRIPLKFIARGSHEQYDDMTDDVASSLIAYAGMAFEYDEVNGVINILENAKYMASERNVVQKSGGRIMRESIDTNPDSNNEGISFTEPFVKKAVGSNAIQALDDFFQMHLYGHIHKAEGTFGKTRISKRKVVDALNGLTSLTQMALNLPQRIANVETGMTQMLIETRGRGHFTFKDMRWAIKTYIKETGDRMAQMGKTDYDNKLSLFADKFDLHQSNGRNHENYSKNDISRIINSNLLYAGLTAGEDALALTTSLAIARHYKVKGPDGKVGNLFDAYDVKYTNPKEKTGAYLSLKSGYTMEDGSKITDEVEQKYAKECAGMNFDMQGIYNMDDRSAIQQYAGGALLIMYRKWIAPSLKRRYGSVKYSALKDEYEEGYHRTLFRLLYDSAIDAKDAVTEDESALRLLNIYDDIKAFINAVNINWDKLSEYEKSNIRKAYTELGIVVGLYLACALSGKVPPRIKEDDPNYVITWADRQMISQLFRLKTELGSQAPTPMMVDEAMHILRSPFAALGPMTTMLNSFNLLLPKSYLTEIKSGRYKGHTQAYKYFRELPIIACYKKIENFIDPTPIINYYKSDVSY